MLELSNKSYVFGQKQNEYVSIALKGKKAYFENVCNTDNKNSDKLGCASVKLLVWLEFTKALSDSIHKKDMKFFFQVGKGKYEPIFGHNDYI